MVKTDITLQKLIEDLQSKGHKDGVPLYVDLSKRLNKPTRSRHVVNLSRINQYTKKDEIVAVPGKVLSEGTLDHPVQIAALSFSEAAREKIKKSGGKTMDFYQLMKKFPKGSNVLVLG